MSWLEQPTTTMPVVEFVCLAGWAVFATALAAWQRRQCYRWHYGIGGGVAWDDRPPATAAEAADGHDTMREAG